MSELLKPAKAPCGSCPYRRDVPSGVWAASEYAKLKLYDGQGWIQHVYAFLCHQRDGHLCAGWVGCHGPRNLLALRILEALGKLDPSTFDYVSPVPLFGSGAEAAEHGMAELEEPGTQARRLVGKLEKRGKGRLE